MSDFTDFNELTKEKTNNEDILKLLRQESEITKDMPVSDVSKFLLEFEPINFLDQHEKNAKDFRENLIKQMRN